MRSRSLQIADFCVTQVVTTSTARSVTDCAQLMRDAHVGSLIVVDPDRTTPVGILTDRDIVLEVLAVGLDPGTLTAGDIMTQPLATVRHDDDLSDALARMREHGVRRLVVVDGAGALYGVLAADNALEVLAEQLDAVVRVFKAEQTREAHTRG